MISKEPERRREEQRIEGRRMPELRGLELNVTQVIAAGWAFIAAPSVLA